MEIEGQRVKCANCGMVYTRPPVQDTQWIGVPFRVVGELNCPKCGSNAFDPVAQPNRFTTSNTSNDPATNRKQRYG